MADTHFIPIKLCPTNLNDPLHNAWIIDLPPTSTRFEFLTMLLFVSTTLILNCCFACCAWFACSSSLIPPVGLFDVYNHKGNSPLCQGFFILFFFGLPFYFSRPSPEQRYRGPRQRSSYKGWPWFAGAGLLRLLLEIFWFLRQNIWAVFLHQ